MSALEMIWSTPLAQAISMALIHFSWQGLLIGSILSMTLISMRDCSAVSRYAACLVAMLLMLLAPIVTTGVILLEDSRSLTSFRETILVLGEVHPGNGWTASALPWFMGFWAVGVSFLQLRLIVSWLHTQKMRRLGLRLLPENLQRDFDDLRAHLGITKAVEVFESALVTVPSVVGWLRPVVLIPVNITRRLTPPQLRAVLAHELAHIQRHDYVVNLMQSVIESVLFFHPVVWWVSDRLRTEREYCCDDAAVSVCHSALRYAQALSLLEELRGHDSRAVLASNGGPLMKRVSRIVEVTTQSSIDRGSWLPPVISLAAVVAIMVAVATGCGTESGDGMLVDQIVGPAEAVEPAEPGDGGLSLMASQLADCRARGFLTDSQVQVGVARLGELIDEDGEIPCDQNGRCRIMIIPGKDFQSRCCPPGAGATATSTAASMTECIRGAENLSPVTEVQIEELDLGDGAVLAFVRFN